MMNLESEIYTFGAGGLAKEVHCLIHDLARAGHGPRVAGFVTPEGGLPVSVGKTEVPVIQEAEALKRADRKETGFALGIGDPRICRKAVNPLLELGARFPNLIHPTFVGLHEGIALMKRYKGEYPLRYEKEFLDYISMDRDELLALCDQFRSAHLWKVFDGEWKLRHVPWNPQ